MLGGQGQCSGSCSYTSRRKCYQHDRGSDNAYGIDFGLGYIDSSQERHTKRGIQKDGHGFDRLDRLVAMVVDGVSGLCVFDYISA